MTKILLSFLILVFSNSSHAAQSSLYNFEWADKGEQVYVIQNKEYVKSKRFGLTMGFGQSNSSPFLDTSPITASLAYYFTEEWGIDLSYIFYLNSNSDDLNNLLAANSTKPLIRKINSATLIHLNWIPVYGKFNLFNLFYFFDAGVGLGGGVFGTQGNYETFLVPNQSFTYISETDMGGSLKFFTKFYFGDRWNAGFEYALRAVKTIKSPDKKKTLHYYNDVSLNIGLMF